jgi:hypothetical protein
MCLNILTLALQIFLHFVTFISAMQIQESSVTSLKFIVFVLFNIHSTKLSCGIVLGDGIEIFFVKGVVRYLIFHATVGNNETWNTTFMVFTCWSIPNMNYHRN